MNQYTGSTFQVSLWVTKRRRKPNSVLHFLYVTLTAICWDGVSLSNFQSNSIRMRWVAGVYSESCRCSLFKTLPLGKQGHFRIPVCGHWCHSACGIINENIYPLSIVQERVIQKRLCGECWVLCGNGIGQRTLRWPRKVRGWAFWLSESPLDIMMWKCDRSQEWWWASFEWQQGCLVSEVETANGWKLAEGT